MQIPERQDTLDRLIREQLSPPKPAAHPPHNGYGPDLSDDQIIALCRKAKNAAKFSDLFDAGDTSRYGGDDSRADQALANIIAFYTRDPDQLDRLFRRSALFRSKWDERRGEMTYGRLTIGRAIASVGETYSAPRGTAVTVSPTSKVSDTVTPIRFAEMGPPGPRVHIVEGIVPKGHTTMLFGDGGSAKSVLALSAAIALAGGAEQWLGRKVKPCPVIYADFELDAEEQRRRAYQLARGVYLEKPPRDLLYISGLAQRPGDVFTGCLEVCEREDVGLMIVDSLGPALGGDAEAGDVIAFHRDHLDPLRAAGVTLIVIDHQGKTQAGERYATKRAFGSVYKENLARSVLQVEPTESREGLLALKVRQKKANFGARAEPFGVRLAFTEEKITLDPHILDAADLAQEPTVNAQDRVVRVLEERSAFPEEIAEAAQMPRGTVKNALTGLRKARRVEETGQVHPHTRAREVRLVKTK